MVSKNAKRKDSAKKDLEEKIKNILSLSDAIAEELNKPEVVAELNLQLKKAQDEWDKAVYEMYHYDLLDLHRPIGIAASF